MSCLISEILSAFWTSTLDIFLNIQLVIRLFASVQILLSSYAPLVVITLYICQSNFEHVLANLWGSFLILGTRYVPLVRIAQYLRPNFATAHVLRRTWG
jgi:hypothetical protein